MHDEHWLGIDVGSRRVGVALARGDVRIARPLLTLANNPSLHDKIAQLVREHHITLIVVGWPRGLEGQTTPQTKITEAFASDLRARLGVPVALQDEALTSRAAETELEGRGKAYSKAEVDALAAAYILEDYLNEHARNYA